MSSIELIEKDGLIRELKLVVSGTEVAEQYQNKISEYAKKARIDGFRPGKAPVKVIEMRYGAGIQDEVVGDIMQKHFEKAIDDQKVKLAGRPSITESHYEKGKDLTFTVSFEVFPEITLQDFNGAEVEKLLAEVTDADIEKMLLNLRKRAAKWEDSDKAAANDDRVIIDFHGFIDDKEFEGGHAHDYQLILGSNSMISGFEEGLVGAKAGESRTLNLTFPTEYHAKDLAGKATRFEVDIKKVQVEKLPELTDEFAKEMGVDGGLEKLRAEVQTNMKNELESLIQSNLKEQVFKQLVDRNPISLPTMMVDQEIDNLIQQTRERFKSYTGMDYPKNVPLPREEFREEARKRCALALLLGEVIRKREIKVSHEEVDARLDKLAQMYKDPEATRNWYHSNEQALNQVETLLLEEKAMEALLAEAKVIEKASSYDEIVKEVRQSQQ